MMSSLRLIPTPPGKIEDGHVWFENQDLLKLSDREISDVRGAKISMIFSGSDYLFESCFYDQQSNF